MRSRFASAIVYAAFVGLASARLAAQNDPIPELLKDQALAVRFQASATGAGEGSSWEEEGIRYTVPGTPVGLKLVGSNLIILVQVTPFDRGKDGIVLIAQGQIWVRRESGELSYRTTLETVSLKYGERILFFPLGRDSEGRAPVRLEIAVERYRDSARNLADKSAADKSAADKAAADKAAADKAAKPSAEQTAPEKSGK